MQRKQLSTILFRFFLILIPILLMITACQKEESLRPEPDKQEKQNADSSRPSSELRASIFPDTAWVKPTENQLTALWNDMLDKANVDEISHFLSDNGLFDWSEAALLMDQGTDEFMISIPTLEQDSVSSVLLAHFKGGASSYFHISLEQLKRPLEELIAEYGTNRTLLALSVLMRHQQYHADYFNTFLYAYVEDDLLADEVLKIEYRGYCLVEVLLYTPPVQEDRSLSTNWYRFGQTWSSGANIGGQPLEGGYTLYRFWAWCPDENDQGGWDFNWTGNTERPRGGGGNNNDQSDWNYDLPRWDEEENDRCLFIFDDPKVQNTINELEKELITASCGAAAAYHVKRAIDKLMKDACNDYFEQNDTEFPTGDMQSTEETISEIERSLEGNTFFQMGKLICLACESDNNTNCITDFSSCKIENYEECAFDKILKKFKNGSNINIPFSEINSIRIIDNQLHIIDKNGILHVFIEPIDINNSTQEEIFDQFIDVISAVNKHFCETNLYEPIDWRDYFDNIGSTAGSINWLQCPSNKNVGFDFNTYLGDQYVTDTSPSWHHNTNSGYVWIFKFINTNFTALAISAETGCIQQVEEFLYPDCN